ncbi:MAG: DNA polymerase III subunit beta [Mycoplasmataceae bacterium]|jgi:DNA polymerase-3 subunit beta|nr:DNA polymerase III subunit beta [Mycoplasmataceae bacterium]
MEFLIDKKYFSLQLKKISNIIKTNDLNNIFAYMKVVCEDEKIFLYASNEIMGIQLCIDEKITIKKNGSFVIEFAVLNKIIEKIKCDSILLKISENSLLIYDKNSSVTLNLFSEQEFVDLSFEENGQEKFILNNKMIVQVNAKILISAIKNKDDITPYKGVCVNSEKEDGFIEFTCTDTHQLSYIKFPFKGVKFCNTLFPSLFSCLILSSSDTECFFSNRRIICKQDNIIYNCALIEGKYQSASKIINSEPPYTVMLSNNLFINCIEKAIIIGGNDIRANFTFLKDEVIISCQNIERGVYSEKIPFINNTNIKEEIKIIFNPSKILSLLKCIETENVVIQFTSPLLPILIKEEKNSNFVSLTLPLRR